MSFKIKSGLFWYIITSLLAHTVTWAGIPVWSIMPLTHTTLSVPSDVTATVKYLVRNNPSTSHTLIMKAIDGITQITVGSKICGNPFTLASGETCTLVLVMTGRTLTGRVIGGPELCELGADNQPDLQLCYQPASPQASLNITPTSAAVLGQSLGGGTLACLGGEPYLNLIAATKDNTDNTGSSIIPWTTSPNPYPDVGAVSI